MCWDGKYLFSCEGPPCPQQVFPSLSMKGFKDRSHRLRPKGQPTASPGLEHGLNLTRRNTRQTTERRKFSEPKGHPVRPGKGFPSPRSFFPAVHRKTVKMYRGGKVCLAQHFAPLWARNVPRFGIAHGQAAMDGEAKPVEMAPRQRKSMAGVLIVNNGHLRRRTEYRTSVGNRPAGFRRMSEIVTKKPFSCFALAKEHYGKGLK